MQVEAFRVAYLEGGTWKRQAQAVNLRPEGASPKVSALALYLLASVPVRGGAPAFTPGSTLSYPLGLPPAFWNFPVRQTTDVCGPRSSGSSRPPTWPAEGRNGMNRKGIAVVVALIGMTVILMLSLAMVQSALGNLKTGSDLLNRAQARQQAEAGVDHALAYLDGKTALSAPKTLSGQGYQVTLTPQNPQGDEIRIESQGQMGLARHTAVAVVRLQPVPAQAQNPLFGQGWISGGRITINGGGPVGKPAPRRPRLRQPLGPNRGLRQLRSKLQKP